MALIDIKADSNLESVLRQFREQGHDLSPFLPVAGALLVAAVSDVFDAQGPGWEPLAEATIKARRNSDASSIQILQDTGVLAASVTSVDNVNQGADFVEVVDGTTYGYWHTVGTKRMPKRDWTDLGPFEQPLLEDVAEAMMESLA
jgi:hypothetical protein